MKLSIKMIIFCLLIGILPLAGMVGYSISTASESLRAEAFEKMAAAAEAKKHNLEDITNSWQQDVEVYARARGVYSALVRLRDIIFYNGKPGERMNPEDEEYAHALKRVERDFSVFVDVMGYQDALLMDESGRVVFTARKGRDLGEDLLKGPLAGSRLARAWKEALSGKIVFLDFHPYTPLNGEPNAFMLGPVKRVTGEIEGVVALRLSLNDINRLMESSTGLGKTGEVFLVGPDMLMRSDYAADMENHSVVASFRSPGQGRMDIEPVRRALDDRSGTLTSADHKGRPVLAAYAPVHIGDTRWAMVAQVGTSEAFAAVSKLEDAALVLSAGSCVFIVLITLLFLRMALFKPLSALRTYAKAVSDGDLEAEATGTFKAELAQVRDALTVMVGNLREKMHEAEEAGTEARKRAEEAETALQDAQQARQARYDADQAQRKGMLQAAAMLRHIVEHMNEASRGVNRESENIRENALSQQMRVEQTVDAIEAMGHNIANVAASATQASEAAVQASERAQTGSTVVHKAVETIGQVNEITDQLKLEVQDLGHKANDIGKIMSVISDIADQTNLLALNAAIEAARAGDAGRGFAVVADEVRKLAEKTMDATREVGDSIAAIQGGVRKNIEGMEQAAVAVEKANGLAGESGQVLDEILEHFDRTSEQIKGIARASEEQSAAGEEISEAVSEVDKVTMGTADAVNHTGKAISNLTRQIEALSKLYGLFRLLGEGEVQGEVQTLSSLPDIAAMNPHKLSGALKKAIREKPFLELAWVTDVKGKMVADIVQAPNAVCTLGSELCGKDWSDRDWFLEPIRTGETFVSSIYYSEIVNDYCLTISAPISDGNGGVKGVLAADIRPSEAAQARH